MYNARHYAMSNRTPKEAGELSTEELLTLIQDSGSLEGFYKSATGSLPDIRASEYLAQLLAKNNLTKQAVIDAAGLDRSTGYMVFAGQRNPKRNTLLRIALAMRLSLEETQRLLKIAQRGELYPKNRRDAAMIYCIHHRLGPIDADLLLDQIGEELLS